MLNKVLIVSGKHWLIGPGSPLGTNYRFSHSHNFLPEAVKESLRLNADPNNIEWLSIDQRFCYNEPDSLEENIRKSIVNGEHVLIDASEVPAVSERINADIELLDPTARARVHFWLFDLENVRNSNISPPWEGAWINDYNEYNKLWNEKKVIEA